MSDARRPTGDRLRPSDPVTPPREVSKRAKQTVETARETLAHTHQALEDTRRLMQQQEEMVQYNRARRERRAELRGFPPATVPPAGSDILLIEDDPADVALFRYALKERALPCQLTILTKRSQVEAFVRQASTATPLFHPRLIIADCHIPVMEPTDIVMAVRTVPAYQRIPVLLFSFLPEAKGQQLSEASGATAFIRKPGELEAFVTTVSSMVYRWGGMGGSADVTPASPQ
jgi:chemotaxis family two-component system response regulator Rcp1